MNRMRIYVDNSVIGGYHDEVFQHDTKEFFKRIKNKEFQIYFSDINEAELALAPEFIVKVKSLIPAECLTTVEQNEESKSLGENIYRIWNFD